MRDFFKTAEDLHLLKFKSKYTLLHLKIEKYF